MFLSLFFRATKDDTFFNFTPRRLFLIRPFMSIYTRTWLIFLSDPFYAALLVKTNDDQ